MTRRRSINRRQRDLRNRPDDPIAIEAAREAARKRAAKHADPHKEALSRAALEELLSDDPWSEVAEPAELSYKIETVKIKAKALPLGKYRIVPSAKKQKTKDIVDPGSKNYFSKLSPAKKKKDDDFIG